MKKALYILSELSDRDFEWLLKAGRFENVSAGNTLIYEGEAISAIYLVMEGTLSVRVEALGGREIARLSQGEVVGEMSFLDHRSPSATVKAIDDVLLWAIPRTQLALKLSSDSAFAAHFYHALGVWLSRRLRGTMSRLGYGYGYGKALDDSPEIANLTMDDLNLPLTDNTELAKIRLDWLLNCIKSSNC